MFSFWTTSSMLFDGARLATSPISGFFIHACHSHLSVLSLPLDGKKQAVASGCVKALSFLLEDHSSHVRSHAACAIAA